MKASTIRLVLALSVGLLAASQANAAANLITNGDFEITTGTLSTGTASKSGLVTSSNLTGWTTSGYVELFTPGSADTTGAPYPPGNSTLKLWGPNDGSNNGLTATSPLGGNFLASDGDQSLNFVGPISQTLNNLTVGTNYLLTFDWAAAQQYGYYGTTTQDWAVTFGAQTQTTTPIVLPSTGFSGWKQASMLFTATSATQTLSFLALGTPSGSPPFSLLDGVSLVAAPEPGTWSIMLVGLVGIVFFAGRQRRRGSLAI